MDNNIDFKSVLVAALRDKRCMLSEEQVQTIVKRYFDPIAARNGGKAAWLSIFNEYGSGDASQMLASYASAINYRLPQTQTGKTLEDALEEANKQTVQTNSGKRVADLIARFNKSLHKCNVEVTTANGRFTALSPDEITELELAVPRKQNALKVEYESWASYRDSHNLLGN